MIETERLILRKPAPEDAPLLGDRVHAWIAEWDANRLGYFTLLRDARILGRVGFHVFDDRTWDLASFSVAGAHGVVELGWTLLPEHRGEGYATEAARAGREWVRRDRLISLIETPNVASARVAERLGATPGETIEIGGNPHVVWEHPA